MAAPSFYQITPLAIDNSPNTTVTTLNTSMIEHVRNANAGEIALFPTALTAFVYNDRQGNNIRKRTILSAAVYNTVNSAFTA